MQELEGKKEVYDEAFQDPNAPLNWRIWSFFCAAIARFGAMMGGEMFHITAFPFLYWNIDKTLGRYGIVTVYSDAFQQLCL